MQVVAQIAAGFSSESMPRCLYIAVMVVMVVEAVVVGGGLRCMVLSARPEDPKLYRRMMTGEEMTGAIKEEKE